MDVNDYCLELYARDVLDAARAAARREALAHRASGERSWAHALAAAWQRGLRLWPTRAGLTSRRSAAPSRPTTLRA